MPARSRSRRSPPTRASARVRVESAASGAALRSDSATVPAQYRGPAPGFAIAASRGSRGSLSSRRAAQTERLDVQAQVLEVEVARHPPHDLVVDQLAAPQVDDGRPLRVEQLAPQALVLL